MPEGIMNEQGESKGSVQMVWQNFLPAALKVAKLLPHARETESSPPQRRWLVVGFVATQILRGRWDTFIPPAASIVTVLSGPGNFLIERHQTAPIGLAAVMGSFLLFGRGTAAALQNTAGTAPRRNFKT